VPDLIVVILVIDVLLTLITLVLVLRRRGAKPTGAVDGFEAVRSLGRRFVKT